MSYPYVSAVPANDDLAIFSSLDIDESVAAAQQVSGVPCKVYGAWVTNVATTTRFLKFYDATHGNTTVGTTVPVITIGIPGNSSDDISAHFTCGGQGIKFTNACTLACTTAAAVADVGAPGAGDLIVNVFYKNIP